MPKAKIFFITGVSTSGKTTLIPHLKKILPKNFLVHDFDERGVPDDVTEEWRRKETKHWLQTALKNTERGKTTVVCGISVPSEVAENKELLQSIEPHYLLLDVSPEGIRERFTKRLSTPKAKKDWARTTGETLEESVKHNTAFAAQLQKICKEFSCEVVSTSGISPEQTASKVAEWILAQ